MSSFNKVKRSESSNTKWLIGSAINAFEVDLRFYNFPSVFFEKWRVWNVVAAVVSVRKKDGDKLLRRSRIISLSDDDPIESSAAFC